MKCLYAVSVLLATACSVTEALYCAAESNPAVMQSAEYVSCQKLTGIDFTGKGRGSLDPALFCGSADCHTLWNQLQRLNYLQCLQAYDGADYRLRQDTSAGKCFDKYGKFNSAVAATEAPRVKTTAVPPVMDASNGGGGGASSTTMNSASPTVTSTSSTTSSGVTSSTTSSSIASSPGAPTPTKASTLGVSTGSKASTASNGVEETRSNEGEASGSGKREAKDEAATLTSTTTQADAITRISEATLANSTGDSPPPTNTPESASAPSNSSSAGTKQGSSILWIAMGCGVAVIVLVAIGLVFVRGPSLRPPERRRKALHDPDSNEGYIATLHSCRSLPSSLSRHSSSGSISILESSAIATSVSVWDDEIIEAIRIPYEKITIGTLVSRGGFGEVYRGMYRNQAVAIKCLLPERRQDMGQIRNFFAEIKLMAVLEHEHIVRLVGVAWDSLNELCVVTELLPRGDLRALIVQYQAKEALHPKGFTPDKIKIALHVAHAITYMHSLQPMVLHRDLKSRNILLNENLDAKITDFGVSRERADSTMTIGVGSSLWMAPEVMTGGRYDDKADVFSFGVVLSELDTHTLPYSHAMEPGLRRRLPDTVVVQMMSTGRLTVEFTDKSPMAQLGRRCVALDPKERPSAAEVQHQIHQLWISTVSE